MNKNTQLKLSSVEIYKKVLKGELKQFPKNFWDKNAAIECNKYLIEEVLKWSLEDVKANLVIDTFKDNKLGGMMMMIYGNKTYELINDVYPDKIKPWEMRKTPTNTWTDEKIREVTRWLIEEKLKWTDDDIRNNLSLKTFEDYKLEGMYRKYKDSPYKIINIAYPDKFKPWELKNAPLNTWNKATAIQAIHWLIEEKLKWSIADVKDKLSIKILEANKLACVVYLYNGNLTNILRDAYPIEFKDFSFKDR